LILFAPFYPLENRKNQDNAEAAIWFRKAAEQGYADAQCALGELYLNGFGVTRDVNEAKIWFNKSARQGNKKAAELLKSL